MRTSSENRIAAFAVKAEKLAIENLERTGCYAYGAAAPTHRFGDELYQRRIAAGLRQADLARLCGLTRGYYSQLENSKRTPPPPRTVDRLCSALQLSAADSKTLRRLADAERCGMVVLPAELPVELAKIVRRLAEKAYHLSPCQLSLVNKAIEEAIAM